MKLERILEILNNGLYAEIKRNEKLDFAYEVITNNGGIIEITYTPIILKAYGYYSISTFVPGQERCLDHWCYSIENGRYYDLKEAYDLIDKQYKKQYEHLF